MQPVLVLVPVRLLLLASEDSASWPNVVGQTAVDRTVRMPRTCRRAHCSVDSCVVGRVAADTAMDLALGLWVFAFADSLIPCC